jgi:hypothetical protein
MTCVWTGIINALKLKFTPLELLKHVQDHNIKTNDILWNGQILTDRMYEENIEWIKSIDPNNINHGYDCSTCDPLLFLIAQLYNVSIKHNYNNTMIHYLNKNYQNNIINFISDRGHFR